MEHKFKITDTFASESNATRDAANRWFVECVVHHTYATFTGRAQARAFIADGAALDFCENGTKPFFATTFSEPVTETVKAAKPAKAPKTSTRIAKFPGEHTKDDAYRHVTAAKETGQDFGKSVKWTVRVASKDVAPKWLVNKMTGVATSEFTTLEAVAFLRKIGLNPVKHETN